MAGLLVCFREARVHGVWIVNFERLAALRPEFRQAQASGGEAADARHRDDLNKPVISHFSDMLGEQASISGGRRVFEPLRGSD